MQVVLRMYMKKLKYPSSFDNTIYRYLYDHELMTNEQYCSSESLAEDTIDSIIALDTNSRDEVNQIKSEFLSSNRLQTFYKPKDSKTQGIARRIMKTKLSEKKIDEIYKVCLEKTLREDDKLDIITGLSERSKAEFRISSRGSR